MRFLPPPQLSAKEMLGGSQVGPEPESPQRSISCPESCVHGSRDQGRAEDAARAPRAEACRNKMGNSSHAVRWGAAGSSPSPLPGTPSTAVQAQSKNGGCRTRAGAAGSKTQQDLWQGSTETCFYFNIVVLGYSLVKKKQVHSLATASCCSQQLPDCKAKTLLKNTKKKKKKEVQ